MREKHVVDYVQKELSPQAGDIWGLGAEMIHHNGRSKMACNIAATCNRCDTVVREKTNA